MFCDRYNLRNDIERKKNRTLLLMKKIPHILELTISAIHTSSIIEHLQPNWTSGEEIKLQESELEMGNECCTD